MLCPLSQPPPLSTLSPHSPPSSYSGLLAVPRTHQAHSCPYAYCLRATSVLVPFSQHPSPGSQLQTFLQVSTSCRPSHRKRHPHKVGLTTIPHLPHSPPYLPYSSSSSRLPLTRLCVFISISPLTRSLPLQHKPP